MYWCWVFMEKRGGVLLVIGIIISVLIVVLLVAGIYLYNFHVFKSVRVCVGDATDIVIPCEATKDCTDMMGIGELDINLDEAPDFVRDNFQKIFNEVVYCDNTCFVKNVRGVNLESMEMEMLESCDSDETEFVVEIRGKDAFEIWKWMESQRE